MKLIKVFLENLEKSDIRYVHWKSNTNIKLALSGIDDLDILVDPNNERDLNDVFKKLKFVRAYSEKDSWQDGITHFLGLDIDSQKLVHVHLHYKLALGFDYDKTYEIIREKAKFHKKINTDNKSVEQVYQSFKEKAYGII